VANGPYATAVANWMEYVRTNETPFITGNGDQRRDMVHVEDVVSANIFAMNHEKPFTGSTFDVGTGQNISLNEIKDIVKKYHNTDFKYIQSRPGDVMTTQANTSGLREIGWECQVSIVDGIDRCFRNLL
jgi:nucleoside-diphosphate-sugar epimerase